MKAAPEEKINNLIHSLATAANIQNEQMIRKAAFRVIDDYGLTNKVMFLERLYFFLADGQERRFIVTEFRKRVDILATPPSMLGR